MLAQAAITIIYPKKKSTQTHAYIKIIASIIQKKASAYKRNGVV